MQNLVIFVSPPVNERVITAIHIVGKRNLRGGYRDQLVNESMLDNRKCDLVSVSFEIHRPDDLRDKRFFRHVAIRLNVDFSREFIFDANISVFAVLHEVNRH